MNMFKEDVQRAETYQLARHLEEVGFDAIHVSNGVYAAAF